MWSGQDRRKFPRAEYPCLIKMSKGALREQPILTHTKSIGLGGICVVVGKKIELMAEIDLELDLKDTSSTLLAKGKIIWLNEIPAAQREASLDYEIGIQFIDLGEEGKRRIQKIINNITRREQCGME